MVKEEYCKATEEKKNIDNEEKINVDNGNDTKTGGQPIEIDEEEMAQFISSVNAFVKEKEEMETQLKRLQADFDNFRKRTRQEKEDLIKSANQQIVMNLLPVIDNFERALANAKGKESVSFVEGIEMIYRQLMCVLEQAGLEVQQVIDEDFDPNFHEAIVKEEVDEDKKGKIIMEIQRGYNYNGKLLRPAMVKVGI